MLNQKSIATIPAGSAAGTAPSSKIPTLTEIEEIVTVAWQQQVTQRRPAAPQANKISTIKWKGGDPSFQQQQQQGQAGLSSSKDETKEKKHHHQGQ